MNDPAIWAAMISGGLALIGTIYIGILNHLGRKEQDRFNAETEIELANVATKAARDTAALEAEHTTKLAGLRAETDRELARLQSELQTERDERLAMREREKVVSKFRNPLLHAAYDLQSRIYNILKRSFLPVYYTGGSESEREYAVENTVFLVAQFLGWTELIREEIQFVDLGNDDETQRLRDLQNDMYTQFQTDRHGEGFRLFAGEQRAVGELMIDRTGPVPRCMGFARFLKERDPQLDVWLDPLREDVAKMAANVEPYEQRLTHIQHSLIELLEFLDPKGVYFPMKSREKI